MYKITIISSDYFCCSHAVPAVTCNTSLSANGVVMVTWFYIHTGGLPLTNVSVSYTYENELIISRPIAVSIISIDTTRITVPDLEAGFRYNFNVTAQNRIGFTSTLCGLTILISGNPVVYHADAYDIISLHPSLPPSPPLSLSLSLSRISHTPFSLFSPSFLHGEYIDQSATVNTVTIVGGVVGGLVILVIIIGFVTLLMILSIRRKGMH